jgi:hypothetical protein
VVVTAVDPRRRLDRIESELVAEATHWRWLWRVVVAVCIVFIVLGGHLCWRLWQAGLLP